MAFDIWFCYIRLMDSVTANFSLPRIRDLRVVAEIFAIKRIGQAAEVANVSQPAATQALFRIESALNVALFLRHPKGVVPTDFGQLFERRLERLLDHLKVGDDAARSRAARTLSQSKGTPFFLRCSPVQLRSLIAVEASGSFSQAARMLGVKQPGVHRAVRELSALAGFEMFVQADARTILTQPAQIFIRHVKLAQAEFRQALFEINEQIGNDTTSINVGSLPLSRTEILPKSIARLTEEFGKSVQVNCVDARYDALMSDLRSGDIDFLIGALRNAVPDDVVQERLITDRLVIITGPGHPLTNRRPVRLDDTLNYPWIAPPKNTPTGSYLFKAINISGRTQTPVRVVSSSLVLLRGLLSRGQFVSIASKRQIETELELGLLVEIPIELTGSERDIGLTYRKDWLPTPYQNRFLSIIRSADVSKS